MDEQYKVKVTRNDSSWKYVISFDAREDCFLAEFPKSYTEEQIAQVFRKHRHSLLRIREAGLKKKEACHYLFGKRLEEGEVIDDAMRKKLLKDYILRRLDEMMPKWGLDFSVKVTVRDMSTRYGSNVVNKKHLSFALSLSSFSPLVIDSVIAHELTHFHYRSHGKMFYKKLESLFPEYAATRKALIHEDFSYGL